MPQIFPMDDDLGDLSKEREILQKLVKAHPPLMCVKTVVLFFCSVWLFLSV
jgi:hypothetical protein